MIVQFDGTVAFANSFNETNPVTASSSELVIACGFITKVFNLVIQITTRRFVVPQSQHA